MKAERTFLRLADGRGFVSDHSRKDAKKVVAKCLAPEIKFCVGQHVIIKQKTKQRSGPILKVNPTSAIVFADDDGLKQNFSVPFDMLEVVVPCSAIA